MRVLYIFLFFCTMVFGYSIQSIDAKIKISSKEKYVRHTIDLIADAQKQMRFSYPLNEEAEIIPLLFSIKDKRYQVYLKNKRVYFNIPNLKKGERLRMTIYYKTLNNQQFLQTQRLFIPHFKNAFNASVSVEVDKDWEIFSHNAFLKGQKYTWQGKIHTKDFQDYLWLSLREANFKIDVTNYVYSTQNISRINLVMPKYFKDSGLKIKKLNFTSTPQAKIIQNTNNTMIAFRDIKARDFKVEMHAEISSTLSESRKQYQNLDPKNFLGTPKKHLELLAKEIIAKSKEPSYIALAKWLHSRIKYDESYMGKHMSSEQVLASNVGVCEHYAQVYADMLNAINIPAVFITGVGFNPFKRAFEYHAWNLVYIDSAWIPIDVTWGLFDGILPVSHIFFYVGYQPLLMYETYEVNISSTHSETKQDIKFIPK